MKKHFETGMLLLPKNIFLVYDSTVHPDIQKGPLKKILPRAYPLLWSTSGGQHSILVSINVTAG